MSYFAQRQLLHPGAAILLGALGVVYGDIGARHEPDLIRQTEQPPAIALHQPSPPYNIAFGQAQRTCSRVKVR